MVRNAIQATASDSIASVPIFCVIKAVEEWNKREWLILTGRRARHQDGNSPEKRFQLHKLIMATKNVLMNLRVEVRSVVPSNALDYTTPSFMKISPATDPCCIARRASSHPCSSSNCRSLQNNGKSTDLGSALT